MFEDALDEEIITWYKWSGFYIIYSDTSKMV